MQRMREEKIEFRRGSAGGESTSAAVPERKTRGLYKTFPMWIMSISWLLHWQFPEFGATDGSGTLQNSQLGGVMSQLWKIRSSTSLLERPPWFNVLVEDVELSGGKSGL